MSSAIVRACGICKSFRMPGTEIAVLRGVDLEAGAREIHAILGASGVGKSTLLHILGTLERPTEGTVRFDEEDVFARSDRELARFRNRSIGFVFQFHHLLPEFTALENVMLPGLIGGEPKRSVRAAARDLLAQVGLSEREGHKPHELSGGEQQRVAVARCLIREPRLVLADEPSGNLDPATSERLHELVYTLAKERGQTWVIATHNENLAEIADKRSRLVHGRLVPEGKGADPTAAIQGGESKS